MYLSKSFHSTRRRGLSFCKSGQFNMLFKKFLKAVLVNAENLIIHFYGNSVHAMTQAKCCRNRNLIFKAVFLNGAVKKFDYLV